MTAYGKPPLAPAPAAYSQRDQQELRNELDRRDDMNVKKDRDHEYRAGTAFIMTDTDDGARYRVTIESGALVLTAL